MCGIVGVVGASNAARDAALVVGRDAMRHRGPDGDGLHLGPNVGLAHTRLAILDRDARSDQPMIDGMTGSVLVFNGEIYNYRELRRELEADGHRFHTSGDTEVLLVSYRRWGTDCLHRLNGMFAFALWDATRDEVFVARDRLGEKPLQFCRHASGLWFASESKALLAAGVARPEVDDDGLYRYLAFGDLGHPRRTMFRQIWQLPPGHGAWITRRETVDEWSYWTIPEEADADPTAEQLGDLWSDAINIRMRSDVPVGTSLSGGPDSSAVIASMRRQQPDGDLHAFTASFPGTEADELPHAQAVADEVGATIHPVLLDAGDLADGLDPMTWANEAPVEAASQFAQYRVMQTAHDVGVVVLLDGQGADEVFGGYDKYAGALAADLVLTGRFGDAARFERAWRQVHGVVVTPPLGRYVGNIATPRQRARIARLDAAGHGWLGRDYVDAHHGVDPVEADPYPPARPGRVAAGLMRQDLARWTLPRLLRYGDRNSMAWSREVRLPYLDHRLVELMARTPAERKIVDGWTKVGVRTLLRSLDLPFVAERRDKKAYMPPQEQWLTDPRVERRVVDAWSDLHRRGFLEAPAPDTRPLHRWRALSTMAWADAFGVGLDG